jgi:hypothetical protein
MAYMVIKVGFMAFRKSNYFILNEAMMSPMLKGT